MSIYKVESGTLIWAVHKPGDAEAPKEFKGKPDTRTFVFNKTAARQE